jgi:transposase
VNRIKSTLARLGIRNFKPTLRKAAERLAAVHTPEGMPLPPNTLAELQRLDHRARTPLDGPRPDVAVEVGGDVPPLATFL